MTMPRPITSAAVTAINPGSASAAATPTFAAGAFLRLNRMAADLGKVLGELGAEENEHACVVDPDENHSQRASTTERVARIGVAEIETDHELADLDQDRGGEATDPDRPPLD